MPDRKQELFDRMERALRELADASFEMKALGVTGDELESRFSTLMDELEKALTNG